MLTVTGIQRFCMHDGPGIRTVVFVKGCPLRCRWCHNPETQNAHPELLYYSSRCIQCQSCMKVCERNAHCFHNGRHTIDRTVCIACGHCEDICPAGAIELSGKSYTVDELVRVIERDRDFYGDHGGLTISGGEPMFCPEETLHLLSECKNRGIRTAIETCGQFDSQFLEKLADVCDLILWDIKDTDANRLRMNTGGNLDWIVGNLLKADSLGIQTVLRCILIDGVNMNEEHLFRLSYLFQKLQNCHGIELLPYHTFGNAKNEALGRKGADFPLIEKSALDTAVCYFSNRHIPVKLFGENAR